MLQRTEGIILQTLNFRDFDQILTVFSPDLGLGKLFFKGAFSRKGQAPSVLTHCEFVFRQTKGDLLFCNEVCVLNQHLALRKDYEILQAACQLLQIIQSSQLPGKPSQDLYYLLLKYLDGLQSIDPKTLVTSFSLKLMRHEGHFHLTGCCQCCQEPLTTLDYFEGQSFCAIHKPAQSMHFSEQEAKVLHRLAYCRKIKDLQEANIVPELGRKIKMLQSIPGMFDHGG